MSVERYGRYEIRREIGRGGMGVVYLAYDPVVRRDVALKVLPAGLPGDDRVIARLRQEARLTAALEHASIVPVYDVGEQGDRPFLVMRYMSGGTVQRWLTNGRLDLRRAGEILTRVAAALDAAHRQGIIHRDLKPSNILFDAQGQAYLSDFGIAKALDAGSNLSLTGTAIVGTPAYMSPEQAIGDKAIDGRSDTYSLGAVAFELLTGRQPYTGDTPMRIALRHIQDPSPRLTAEELAALHLPAEVGAALTRAMAKDPTDRFDSPLDLARAIGAAAGLPDPSATTQVNPPQVDETPVPARLPRDRATLAAAPAMRWPRALGLGCLSVGLVGLMAVIVSWAAANPPGGAAQATTTPTPTQSQTSVASPTEPALSPSATSSPRLPTASPRASSTPSATSTPTQSTTPTQTATDVPATRRPPTRVAPTPTTAPPTSAPPTSAPPATSPPIVDPPTFTPAPPDPPDATPTVAPP